MRHTPPLQPIPEITLERKNLLPARTNHELIEICGLKRDVFLQSIKKAPTPYRSWLLIYLPLSRRPVLSRYTLANPTVNVQAASLTYGSPISGDPKRDVRKVPTTKILCPIFHFPRWPPLAPDVQTLPPRQIPHGISESVNVCILPHTTTH